MTAQQLHASFPNSFFPGFFPNTWQLPDFLSSAPILKWLLLLLHTHTVMHLSQGERRVVVKTFSSVLLPPQLYPEHPGEFYFQFSNSIFDSLKEKKPKPHYHLHISFATNFFSPCPLFSTQRGHPNAGMLLQQRCCVSVPAGMVAEFHSTVMTSVTVVVSPLVSCTLKAWASTFAGYMIKLMLGVKIFICPVGQIQHSSWRAISELVTVLKGHCNH